MSIGERGSGVEALRRANLGEVLRLVHEGARPRATLTAEMGLNRSTTAALVADLVEAGLVSEQNPDPSRRVGRPSPVVVPNDDVVAIGVNPEIDAIEIGAVGLGGRLRQRVRIVKRMPSITETVDIVASTLAEWRIGELAQCRLVGVGVAVPGLVRAEDGLVRLAPHLEWRDADIAGPLSDAVELPVTVANDASLGARAESVFGAARQQGHVVYLNGGASGIGGGLIVQGALLGGAGGYAGEWGQTTPGILDEADRRAPGGVLEDEVNRARLLEIAGVDGGDDSTLAAALGQAGAAREAARQRRILAATLGNAVNVLNPSMIVLGGFLAVLRNVDAERFDADVRERSLAASAEKLQLAPAALGADRLLIGAAHAAFDPLMAAPLRRPTAAPPAG